MQCKAIKITLTFDPKIIAPSFRFFTVANICFCEHPNERIPSNGIMCGDPSKGNYERTGYCGAHERCTGPGNPSQGIDASRANEALCETGRLSTIENIFSGLYNKSYF